MESDWHPHSRLPTLPSVAELLASSSRPAIDSIAAHHQEPNDPQRPVPRSTPPNTHAVLSAAPANAPASSEQSCCSAANHASHASPFESITSTSSTEQHHNQPSSSRPASTSFASTISYEAILDPQRTARPNNSGRQDSAIAQQPIDPSKDISASELNALVTNRSPNDGYYLADSGLSSYSGDRSPVLPASDHLDASSSRSNEHVAHSPACVPPRHGLESSHKRTNPSLPPDLSNNSNTRQQRYNVRFAANHTPSNMPIAQAQKPRPSPPLMTALATRATVESPSLPQAEPVVRTIEPAIQAITRSLQPPGDSYQPEDHGREPSVDRCSRCGDAWERPLPNMANWDQDLPAENTKGFARATMNLISQMRQHGKEADQQYEQWKEKHSRCPLSRNRGPDTSLDQVGSSNSPHRKVVDGHSYTSDHVQHTTNKRKSETSHGNPAKHLKVAYDSKTSTAPAVRPSAPL